MAGSIKMNDFALIISVFFACFIGVYAGFMVFSDINERVLYEVRTCQDLMNINKDLDGTYILMNDIDCGEYLNDY